MNAQVMWRLADEQDPYNDWTAKALNNINGGHFVRALACGDGMSIHDLPEITQDEVRRLMGDGLYNEPVDEFFLLSLA
jgi:hypothetical protein